MSFWTSQKLVEEQDAHALIESAVHPFDEKNLDCNAYKLHIGPEIYVSPAIETPDPESATITQLSDGQAFKIPPGQFAFILTEEAVRVPKNPMPFISIRTKIKCRALLNISR